jgi:RNA polymerase sigma-70 factor (ECF subfamily)
LIDLEETAARVRAGDAAAFASIVRETSRGLARLAMRMMGSESEGEDVLQQAYLDAFEAIAAGRYRTRGPGSLQGWLYRVVSNAGLVALRSRRRESRKKGAATTPEVPHGPNPQEARLALRELSARLDALPPEQRVAVVLKELEGRTSREIAEALGISEGAVEQRLVRARRALKEEG